ncbi:MAG: DUF1302 family protein [Marinifilaceae bacterium]
MKSYYCLLLFLFCSSLSFGQAKKLNLDFTGFIDTYHAVRSQSPNDFMSSRTRFRGELKMRKNRSIFYTSFNATHNKILEDQSDIELREAFFEYSGKSWDLKVGRQIVIWGVSDGMRITDVVSPMDMTEYLARDYDDIRIPVTATRFRWLRNKMSAELIFIPVSSFYIIPHHKENPWSFFSSGPNTVLNVNTKQVPDKTLENCEYGGRLSFFLSGIDFTFSALHTWNKMPVFTQRFSSDRDTLSFTSQHARLDMLGFDFSVPINKFVLRGEVAGYLGELQNMKNSPNQRDLLKRNTTNTLLGIDWYPGNEWTVTAQYALKYIPNHTKAIKSKQTTKISTFGATKKLLRSTLLLSTFSYWDMTNKSCFNRTYADYALTDEIHVSLGYDWFHGDKGMFAPFKNNSEYWFKAKYSF